MKDAIHHLKYVQKKVVQSIRKDTNSERSKINESKSAIAVDMYPKNFEKKSRG